jgi:hypothetical protein
MLRWLALALLATSAFAVVPAPSADAAGFVVTDPVGEDPTNGPVLDITRLRVNNRDRKLVVEVTFVRAGRGDLIVTLYGRGETPGEGTGIVSKHRPRRGDVNQMGTRDGILPCDGLSVVWDHESDTATVRVPPRCIDDGDYGDLRVRVLTEIVVDQDFAPDGPPLPDADQPSWRWSPWIPRG